MNTTENRLAKLWCTLNRKEWPKELGPFPFCPRERISIMRAAFRMVDAVARRAGLRRWRRHEVA